MFVLVLRRGLFLRLGGHDAVELGILGEPVHKRQNDGTIKKQPFAFTAMGDIGELMGRNIQMLCENLTVARCLVEHIDIVRVLKDVFDLTAL